jgi:phosphopantetheinyl transferase (holo-ACP synthase)
MLGNDIIDRAVAAEQSNWRRSNYLAKIFTPAEQLQIKQADDPDLLVWLIWSMKEAVYKIINRSSGKRFFNPLALICKFNIASGYATGTVTYQQDVFATTTQIREDLIHTVAVGKGFSFTDVEVIHGVNQKAYLEQFNFDNPTLRLQKNSQRLPEIYHLEKKSKAIATLSHHGSKLCVAFFKFGDYPLSQRSML